MSRRITFRMALPVVIATLFVSTARAQTARKIEWQTDLLQAFQLSKNSKSPLIAYVYSDAGQGPDARTVALEQGALSSRELDFYRQNAVFVRINAARDDQNQNASRFIKQAEIKVFPSLVVMDCWDDGIFSRDPIPGDKPSGELLPLLRHQLIGTIVSIQSHGQRDCTNAEYVAAWEAWQNEYTPLLKEFVTVNEARKAVLAQLRDGSEFRLDALQTADQHCFENRERMVQALLRLAKVKSADFRDICCLELEDIVALSDTNFLLRDDLTNLSLDGRTLSTFATTLARIAVKTSEERAGNELLGPENEAAALKISQRIAALRQPAAGEMVKR